MKKIWRNSSLLITAAVLAITASSAFANPQNTITGKNVAYVVTHGIPGATTADNAPVAVVINSTAPQVTQAQVVSIVNLNGNVETLAAAQNAAIIPAAKMHQITFANNRQIVGGGSGGLSGNMATTNHVATNIDSGAARNHGGPTARTGPLNLS